MAAIAMTWWALGMPVRVPKPLPRFADSCPKRKSAGSFFQKTRSGCFESDALLTFPFCRSYLGFRQVLQNYLPHSADCRPAIIGQRLEILRNRFRFAPYSDRQTQKNG